MKLFINVKNINISRYVWLDIGNGARNHFLTDDLEMYNMLNPAEKVRYENIQSCQ